MTCLALLAQSSRKLKWKLTHEPGLTWASLKNDHLAPHWFLAKRRTLFTLNSRKSGSRKQGVFLWTESFSNWLTKIKEDFYDLEPNSFPSSLPTQYKLVHHINSIIQLHKRLHVGLLVCQLSFLHIISLLFIFMSLTTNFWHPHLLIYHFLIHILCICSSVHQFRAKNLSFVYSFIN